MTKSEIQQKYAQLATRTGDLYLRLEAAKVLVEALDSELAKCKLERQDLEQALKTAEDDPVAEVTDPNV
jgi:cell division protein FtsB